MASAEPKLRLYNTLTRQKDDFTPFDPGHVRMYVCGPTVYDYAHIGNARPVIVFDVLYRLLRHLYGDKHVTYVRNITDVDDKIMDRARERGIDIRELTEETNRQFQADMTALGCLEPDQQPRATETIDEMIAMIRILIDRKHAYVAKGEVLFDVASMPDYGRLSNRDLDEQRAGARVEVDRHKRNPGDFVLWKSSTADQPGWEAEFDGIRIFGRPGWHIECSAMSDKWLWDAVKDELSEAGRAHPHQFDIHGGGIDLIFPHHENEIAQSRCAHGTPAMAQVWMHNGYLQV
ncbi:MAG TPA: cysteine--tRNA ligase, partial [Devosiaceae bacterium]